MRKAFFLLFSICLLLMVSILIVVLLLSASAMVFAESVREGSWRTAQYRGARTDFAVLKAVLEQSRAKPKTAANPDLAGSGQYSYCYFIPYVTSANNTRTNIGINNYGLRSVTKGNLPTANVRMLLFDEQGRSQGEQVVQVQSNQLYQINGIINRFGSSSSTGWMQLWADEPITAWASVINNSTNDPSIESAVVLSTGMFDAYVEGLAVGVDEPGYQSRLLIASSARLGVWQSSLVITNVSEMGGNYLLTIYDNSGQVLFSGSQYIGPNSMYVNDDVRSIGPGTYGQIIIEPQTQGLVLIASSLIKTANGTGAFFPARTLPSSSNPSMAGLWEGTTNTQSEGPMKVKFSVSQDGARVFGFGSYTLPNYSYSSGDFPVSGELIGDTLVLEGHHLIHKQTNQLMNISIHLFANLSGDQLVGSGMMYNPPALEQVQVTLSRTGGTH
jgi:hypothetical protein